MSDQAAELRRLMTHLKEAGPKRPTPHLLRTLAITSGKGGVGKTNIAVNLCLALAERGVRVILVDVDWGLSNTEIIMGIQPGKDLRHVLNGECDIEDILLEGPMGMKLVPGASGVTELANLTSHQRERLTGGLTRLHSLADLIVFDTSPGISDAVIDLATSMDQIFVVTSAEPTSLTDAYAYTKVIFQRRSDASVGLLVNMADDRSNAESIWAGFNSITERQLGRKVPLVGFICTDPKLPLAVRRMIPLMVSYPKSQAADCFRRIADTLLGTPRLDHRGNELLASGASDTPLTIPPSLASSPTAVPAAMNGSSASASGSPAPVEESVETFPEKPAAEPPSKTPPSQSLRRSILRFFGLR